MVARVLSQHACTFIGVAKLAMEQHVFPAGVVVVVVEFPATGPDVAMSLDI